MNETKGSFSIALAHEPRLHVALEKRGLARGSNYNNTIALQLRKL